MAAYRIIQESLTNAIRHAGPGHHHVCLDYDAAGLRVEVADTGRGRPPGRGAGRTRGHGLIGMRERAAALGGTLEAGPGPAAASPSGPGSRRTAGRYSPPAPGTGPAGARPRRARQ